MYIFASSQDVSPRSLAAMAPHPAPAAASTTVASLSLCMNGLTPAVSRTARSEASGGYQPGTGWCRLDQPVRLGSVGTVVHFNFEFKLVHVDVAFWRIFECADKSACGAPLLPIVQLGGQFWWGFQRIGVQGKARKFDILLAKHPWWI